MSTRGAIGALLLIVIAGGFFLLYPRFESEAPTITADESVVLGRQAQMLAVDFSDAHSGLRNVVIRLQSASGSRVLLEQEYPGSLASGGLPGGHSERVEVPLDPEVLRLPDGPATLIVTARDWSLRDGTNGNRGEHSVHLTIDTRPVSIAVESGLTYVYRGGSAAAVYRVDDDSVRDGVQVGDAFFQGYPLSLPADDDSPSDQRRRIALFAVPVESEGEPAIRVVATDLAGNESGTSFPARVFERRFPDSRIALSQRFLRQVAEPLATENDLAAPDLASAFRAVNEELRATNEATIREAVAKSSDHALWSGAFSQMVNSKVTSRFAESRTYTIEGQPVSTARHFGFDLASTSGAPVTASNDGVVLYADALGIYGNCVIVDHGLSLVSLYAHLSRIDAKVGDQVAKNHQLGLSGATGLAGGDHLHFAILVGNEYVDPMEWWDPRWVKSHIGVRITP